MKPLCVVVFTFFTCFSYGQPIKEKFTAAIAGIEKENYVRQQLYLRNKYKEQLAQAGDTATDIRVTSITVDIFSYSLIPLKNWWKEMLHIHTSWYTEMHDLALTLAQPDGKKMSSTERRQFDKMFRQKWEEKKRKDTTSFDYVKYFKDKYDHTDPSVKVYQVFYKVDLEATHDRQYHTDTLKIALYPGSLEEVKSLTYTEIQ